MRTRLVVIILALAAACGGGTQTVSLAELAAEPERFHDSTVTTSGVVVEFAEDEGALERHFVVQDTEANRVKLEPVEEAESFVGQIVRVTGDFTFSDTQGRVLRIDEIGPPTSF